LGRGGDVLESLGHRIQRQPATLPGAAAEPGVRLDAAPILAARNPPSAQQIPDSDECRGLAGDCGRVRAAQASAAPSGGERAAAAAWRATHLPRLPEDTGPL